MIHSLFISLLTVTFEKYLQRLARYEAKKAEPYLEDPRRAFLVHAGIHLNWLGDFLGNPKIQWRKRAIPVDAILFTGTNPEWNKIFIQQCERSPKKLLALVRKDAKLANRIKKWARASGQGKKEILLRKDGDYYKVLDGMHRFIGLVLTGRKSVRAYVPINEREVLPVCEPHVVYDLIRGFERHAADATGGRQLEAALLLLSRAYDNVPYLLKNRFNQKWVPNPLVQNVLRRILQKTKARRG